MKNNKKGFTLIELLVVVLIIGILAAIALPQYFKAVEKSKSSEALSVLGTIASANERYRLASPTAVYTTDYSNLDIDLLNSAGTAATGSSYNTKNFSVALSGTDSNAGVVATRSLANNGYKLTRVYGTNVVSCSSSVAGFCASLGL